MIKTKNIINEWEIDSFWHFIQVFHIQEQVLKDFPDIDDVDDVCMSNHFISDDDHIKEYLEQFKELYIIDFVDTGYWEGWIIREVKE